MRRPHAAAAVLCALLVPGLLAGCSGSDEASPAPSTSASGSAVDTLISSGLAQVSAGQTAAAQTTFENVLDLDPDNAYAHYNLGYLAQQAGDTKTAMTEYDAALATDPTLASALYNLGILTEPTDLSAAVKLYQQATAAQPDLAPAFMRLGFALLYLGQQEEGEAALAEGIRLDPSMKDVEPPTYD